MTFIKLCSKGDNLEKLKAAETNPWLCTCQAARSPEVAMDYYTALPRSACLQTGTEVPDFIKAQADSIGVYPQDRSSYSNPVRQYMCLGASTGSADDVSIKGLRSTGTL